MSVNKGGRPTKYSPEVLDIFEEYIQEAVPQNMKIPTVEGLALKIGVTKKTLYNWSKEEKNKEFLHALKRLKMLQREYLTEIGIFGGKEVNATIVKLMLTNNHKMKDRSDVTSDDEKMQGVIIYKPTTDDE